MGKPQLKATGTISIIRKKNPIATEKREGTTSYKRLKVNCFMVSLM